MLARDPAQPAFVSQTVTVTMLFAVVQGANGSVDITRSGTHFLTLQSVLASVRPRREGSCSPELIDAQQTSSCRTERQASTLLSM